EPRVAAIAAATLVAQLMAGAVILVFAGGSGRKVGPAFILSLTAFLFTLGGAAFFTWKGW
ncbi:MAG TPA: hypothetical protein VI643_06655, partial [Planctomycetota bacterium]|nr:hypothetical protein [Planctomycetota bacterium]